MGAPVGNFNALKHGERSPRKRAERLAERRAREAEERQNEAWMAPRREADRAQHVRIMDELDRLRREAEAEGDYRWSRRR
jgi:hypothetical protein